MALKFTKKNGKMVATRSTSTSAPKPAKLAKPMLDKDRTTRKTVKS